MAELCASRISFSQARDQNVTHALLSFGRAAGVRGTGLTEGV